MGYDCYVRTENGAERYDDGFYFRRSIWGGEPLGNALIQLGMGFIAKGQQPEWPDEEKFDVEYVERRNPDGTWFDGYVGPQAEEFQAAHDRVLSWHGDDPDAHGIPCHKVWSSNDGWHVTRVECEQALTAYRERVAAGAEHPRAFGDDFIPFLELAAQHDGFEVH